MKHNFRFLIAVLMFLAVQVGVYAQIQTKVYTGNLGPKPLSYVEGRVVVKFHEQVDKAAAEAIARRAGARLERQGYGNAFHLASVPAGTVLKVIDALSKNPNVEFAHPDWIAHAYAVPNDPLYYPYQWHLDNPIYGGIEMEQAWDIVGGGDSNVIVAVLDTGIAYSNTGGYCMAPDLAATSFIQGKDFINGDDFANDDEGHGTHVAGTIAQSTNNAIGTAGVAYATTLMPVKVLDSNGSGPISVIAEGIRWAADNGADIINMILGIDINPRFIRTLQNAVQYAYNKGVLIVAAAGNSGRSKLSYPAGYPEVIAVAATTYQETLASYSNSGDGLELSAPGGDNGDLNGDGFPDMVLQQTFNIETGNVCDFTYYWFFSGTSMASPHVAGVAALLYAAGAQNAAQVREILQQTADDLGVSGYDTTFGYGLVNAHAALQALGPVDQYPSVLITSPAEGATVRDLVEITADASDDVGVSQVEFSIDGIPLFTDTDGSDGWSALWDTTVYGEGAHEVSAVATDSASQSTEDVIAVTIDNVDDPPAVSLTSPTAGATVGDTVLVIADASDDVGVTQVEFLINGITLDVDTDGSDGWSTSWDTTMVTNGSYTLAAEAADTLGQTALDSIPVTVYNSDATSIHVGDLDGIPVNEAPRWHAIVTVTIHDENHTTVTAASVVGEWGGGDSGSVAGTTDANGQCTFVSSSIHKRFDTISFTVNDVVVGGQDYIADENHDPDGDSNGTTIYVIKE